MMVQHSTNQEPRIRQNPRFTDRSGLVNPDRRVNHLDVLHNGELPSREQEQVKKHIVMVGPWLCTVSSEVHINGRFVSEMVQEDKGKAMVSESENEKDSKRACMVLSKGHEVLGPGYSRLSGDAARVSDRGEESGNPNRVHWEYDTDRQIDRVTWDSRVTGMDTRVSGQTGLLRTARVTRTMTQVGGQTGLLETAGVARTVASVSRQIGLHGTAGVTGMTAWVSR
jgi:hypothetical protein